MRGLIALRCLPPSSLRCLRDPTSCSDRACWSACSVACTATLVSAPAGSGKTTPAGEWAARRELPVSWLSPDAGDNDPTRFLMYFVAAVQTIASAIGAGLLQVLQSP